jgi:hypothetical protein
MATIKIRWHVDELVNVMSIFDVQKIYRSTTGPAGTYNEMTSVATRVPLVALVESYLYDDVGGDASYYYKISYYNSVSFVESNLSDPIRGGLSGYLTIQEVRDEGFNDPPYSDERVIDAIAMSTSVIEKITGQWFEARVRTFQLDVKNSTLEYLLEVPVITLTEVKLFDEVLELSDLWIYNRHLTQGISDDLMDPKIAFVEDYYPNRVRRFWGGRRQFPHGNRNLKLTGYFGYTMLSPTETPAETAEGSQVPTSYGQTPPEIKRAALLLVAKYLPTIASGDGSSMSLSSRMTSLGTRDQSVGFAAPTAQDGSYGETGILEVDMILRSYMGPMAVGVV